MSEISLEERVYDRIFELILIKEGQTAINGIMKTIKPRDEDIVPSEPVVGAIWPVRFEYEPGASA